VLIRRPVWFQLFQMDPLQQERSPAARSFVIELTGCWHPATHDDQQHDHPWQLRFISGTSVIQALRLLMKIGSNRGGSLK
jgi:hypothetical protein